MDYTVRAALAFLGAIDRAERARWQMVLTVGQHAAQGGEKDVARLRKSLAGAG